MMAGSFTGPALGGLLADVLGVRCARFPTGTRLLRYLALASHRHAQTRAQDSSVEPTSATPIISASSKPDTARAERL